MHQLEYIAFLLQEYGLSDCNPVRLPADPKASLSDPSILYPDVANLQSAYLKLVGELIYLSVNTRPDISYIINTLAQHNANPEPCHFVTAKCVLHYLARTMNLHLCYEHDGNASKLHAYADASWASETRRRSVSGYTWSYASGLISHISKKQTTVALSSTKAEYMAATHVTQEGLWLCSLFTELKVPFASPVPIYLDNSGAIALSTAAKFHQHSKHIDI